MPLRRPNNRMQGTNPRPYFQHPQALARAGSRLILKCYSIGTQRRSGLDLLTRNLLNATASPPKLFDNLKDFTMRRIYILPILLAFGFAFSQLTNAGDKPLPSPPATADVNSDYTPVTDLKVTIRSKMVLKTGATPESLTIVSRPIVISQNGQTSTIEITESNGQTIRLEITNEVVAKGKN